MFTMTIQTTIHHHAGLRGPGSTKQMEKSATPEKSGLEHNSLLLTEALAVAHNAPDTRQERIEALRAQIARGEYEIDAVSITEGILRENPGLFQK